MLFLCKPPKLKKIKFVLKKCLQIIYRCVIMINVVTLIAWKREVAAESCGFSVERMSSYENWRQVTVQEHRSAKGRKPCKLS